MTGPAPNPRIGRQRYLTAALTVCVALTVAAAAAALVLPGEAGSVAGRVMVGLLIGAPVLRVAWLLVRWLRLGDRRFALAATALLGVLVAAVFVR